MVITIIILIILATITINFAFGENGLITRAQWAQEQYEIEQVREKLEMAKGSAFADGKGKIDPDHYFDILEQEEIIGSKENDVKDNGDGTYDVTTEDGYKFEITLVPSAENPEDLEIEYVGKGDVIGPRISSIDVTGKTTNSISISVEGRNLEDAEYTYSYKKSSDGEETWTEVSTDSSSNTCTITGLETGVTYDIKVVVTTSEGTAEKQISEVAGELKEGSITIGNTNWQGDGTAKVTVTTDITEPGCYIEYKIGVDGSWTRIDSGDEITLELNEEIYVRVTDGTNTLADAYRKISDNGLPTVSVTSGGTTSNSITVNVVATDAESGMKDGTTYTYYIKESSQADTAYEAKATDVTNTSYTFTGLNQNTSYDIKVEVNGDRAGNKGTGTLLSEGTQEIAGATEGLREGSIVATTPTWSGGQASITLTTDTGLKIQYQVGGTTGTWTTIDSGGQVTGLNHNDTVYARLWDEKNAGTAASVEIRDTGKPSVSVSTSNLTSNSVTLTVTASDAETGLATSETYTYYLNNGSATPSTSNTHNYTGLTDGTTYELKVVVKDKAGNTQEASTTITTVSMSIANVLEEGNYVNYIDNSGTTRKSIVLYDSSSEYGIQIITQNTVENVSFGDRNSFENTKQSYNSVVSTLNTRARAYLNTTYASSARCVGTLPNNPDYETSGWYTSSSSWFSSYNGQFKSPTDNYLADYNQMSQLNIIRSDYYYYFASLRTGEGPNTGYDQIWFGTMYYSLEDDIVDFVGIAGVYENTTAYAMPDFGVRPVFTLNTNLKVTGGSGTEGDPYTLGV